jgi:uncharacterized protein (DUF3084 family)
MTMNLDSAYKKAKEEAAYLVNREKELKARVEELKKVKQANTERQANIKRLEAELENLLK